MLKLLNHNFGTVFLFFTERCDGILDCLDSTDEIGCKCKDDQFTCHCYSQVESDCYYKDACISIESYRDGIQDCPDGSDEILSLLNALRYDQCSLSIRRLNEVEDCIRLGLPTCSESTCFKTPSLNCSTPTYECDALDVICMSQSSNCADNITELSYPAFQCLDGSLIFASQFCDGQSDCPDESDETRNQPGFKCKQSKSACVLPQRNLYDDVAHCVDQADLCNKDASSCFECFDKGLMISLKQVCDGVIDCWDLSDECLCYRNYDKPICNAIFLPDNNSTTCRKNALLDEVNSDTFTSNPLYVHALDQDINISKKQFFNEMQNHSVDTIDCETKHSKHKVKAAVCDGRPECRDFSDECNCQNPPPFCNDSCRFFYNYFYPLGDRYCDGVEDKLEWQGINRTACPPGFDEQSCPKRFVCRAGDKVSIDELEVCNGVNDCDNGSDESNCSKSTSLFSSDTEMIDNLGLRSAVWIIAIAVIIGNVTVMVTKIKFLRTTSLSDSLRCQHLIILNISLADFLMGIYLLAIAVYSVSFSGRYGLVDAEWRMSLRCSIIGSLAVISGETTCLLMVTLTAFRLHGIFRPFASETSPTWPWKLFIFAAWLISLVLGILPILHQILPYFVYRIYFPILYNKKGMWIESDLVKFACRFAALANKTISISPNPWESAQSFLETNFPENFPLKEFGYYGETSVCMPRFYIQHGDSSWEYSLALITINFLCFVFIAGGYISILVESNKSMQKESVLQRRIARIIATDLCCWIPVCILAYARISGFDFEKVLYQITAIIILPINSALNPFLYSPLFDKMIKKMTFW